MRCGVCFPVRGGCGCSILLALIAAALYGLFYYAFPWIASNYVPDNGVIDESAATIAAYLA